MKLNRCFVLLVCGSLFTTRAFAGDLNLGGTIHFQQLDGGGLDEDGTANGTLRLNTLRIAGSGRLVIDVADARIEVVNGIRLEGNGSIAPPSSIPDQGPNIRISSGDTFQAAGTSSISANGALAGGSIEICAVSRILLSGNVSLMATSNGMGGTIRLQSASVISVNSASVNIHAAGGTDGGSVELISCAEGNEAQTIKGYISANGASGRGGFVLLEARNGGINFHPSRATGLKRFLVSATGQTAPGSITIKAATVVAPNPPPTTPSATVCMAANCVDSSISCACVPTLLSLRIEPNTLDFNEPDQRQQLRVLAIYSNGTTEDVTDPSTGTTYHTTDLEIATVNDSGLVAPIARGTTKITAINGQLSALAMASVSFCRPATPLVNALPSPTKENTVVVSGSAEPGSTVEVSTSAVTLPGEVVDGQFAVTIPLPRNRRNTIYVTAIADCGARSSPATLMVTHDTRPPNLFIDSPQDGAKLTSETVDVAGRVGDSLTGFMGLTVNVNGQPALVDVGIGTNGTFLARNVPLSVGIPNVLTATATDEAGNFITKSVTVERIGFSDEAIRLEAVSGNAQSAPIHTYLAEPIVVRVVNPDGNPFANKLVAFDVTRSDGRLSSNGGPMGKLLLQVRTDTQGLARAFWKLGGDAGSGNDRVEVTSVGVEGKVFFCASATPGPAAQINIGSGNNQRADAGGPAPEPLNAWVSDSCNGLSDVPVVFRVIRGGGKVNALDEVTVPTDVTGHAQVNFTLGPDKGNNQVEADYEANPTGPATFVVYGLIRNENLPTSFSGLVLDNSLLPIGAAHVVLKVGGLPPLETLTGENGQFQFSDLQNAGPARLSVEGLVATTLNGQPILPGSFPNLSYDAQITPNAENSLNTPVLLPPLNPNNAKQYSTTQDTILTCEGMEGLKMIVKAGSMKLANGNPAPNGTILTLNQVHHDDIPMPIPDGAAPPFAWTLQPGGATFDPPIKIEYPNMSALPPGAIANFLSFDHSTNRFEIISSGSVSDDGSIITTDSGSGLTIAGWGCNCPPYSVTGECCTGANAQLRGPSEECCEKDPRVIEEVNALKREQESLWRSAEAHFTEGMRLGQVGMGTTGSLPFAQTAAKLIGLRTSWTLTQASFAALRPTVAVCTRICAAALVEPSPFGEIFCGACGVTILAEGGVLAAGVGGTLGFAYLLYRDLEQFLNLSAAINEFALAAIDAAAAGAIQGTIEAICAALVVSDNISQRISELQQKINEAKAKLQALQEEARQLANEIAEIIAGLERIRETVQGWIDIISGYLDQLPGIRLHGSTQCLIQLPIGGTVELTLPIGVPCDQDFADSIVPDPDILIANEQDLLVINDSFNTADVYQSRAFESHTNASALLIEAEGELSEIAITTDVSQWQLTIGGQVMNLSGTGTFLLGNVAAPDQFGVTGPGSPPDFLSDDFLRVTGFRPLGDRVEYAFGEFFQFRNQESFVVPTLTIADGPPPSVTRIDTAPSLGQPVILNQIGQASQLATLGEMNDGTLEDVTQRTAWTVYRTSNPGVVTVGPNGEVTARGAGRAFVTATNEGATAVTSLTVALDDPLTTVEGFVRLEDGTFVEGAEVIVPGQGASTITDSTGRFFFSGIATSLGDIRVRASKENLVGTSDDVLPVPGGITDVGFVTLRVPATSGREFVVAFEPNYDNIGVELTLFISGDEPSSGEVSIPGINFVQSFAVLPGQVTAVSLPLQALTIGSDVIVNRGIHVVADRNINLYGLNRMQFSTDAFAGFPVESLGTEYRVMGHTDLGHNNNRSQFAVVATEDNTTVFITPTASTVGHPAGATFGVILNRLQVYQLRSSTSGTGLTGSRIVSDQPVAVFSGNSCANVPTSNIGFCDHVCEQMPPTGTWGQQVLTLPLATRLNGDTFRILADQNQTVVNIAGPIPQTITLNAGQFTQRVLTGNNDITADKPILVTQFSNGTLFDGVVSDPFMTLVPPAEQFLSAYTFTTPGSGFDLNFVNVLANSADAAAGAVTLDGVAIPSAMFQLIGVTGFSCAKIPISVGSHTMTAPSPFGIYVYGFADADSYGYPGGLSLQVLGP